MSTTIPTDPPEGNDDGLAGVRARFPAWVIWRGRTTGHYWGSPPAGFPDQTLISARDPAELAERIAQAEGRTPLS